ncbi:MAG: AMP-binding protein [Deltaproteobacteria bacterium]|nr:AMP-binding protein [Deltaproteobacteria bacterium]
MTYVNTLRDFMFGTVGKPVVGTELRMAEDEEILIRGPQVVKGYYKNESTTKEAFNEDGFFKIEDIGEIVNGFLKITKCKKNIIITSGRKILAKLILQCLYNRFVSQAIIIVDKRPYLTMLLVPEFETPRLWAKESKVIGLFENIVEEVNQHFAHVERVRKFRLLRGKSIYVMGDLTPTFKLKRKEVLRKYAEISKEMYRSSKF